MGKPQRRSGGRSANSRKHSYPRAARISETVREVVAEELVRIDDDRLAFVTITSIDVDSEMNQIHARRTPILEFRPDEAIRAAARIEEVLRNDPMHTRNLTDDTNAE